MLGVGADSTVDHAEAKRALQRLDPKSITSIYVLKQATAIARFGSAAHDGAVLITTGDGATKGKTDP